MIDVGVLCLFVVPVAGFVWLLVEIVRWVKGRRELDSFRADLVAERRDITFAGWVKLPSGKDFHWRSYADPDHELGTVQRLSTEWRRMQSPNK